MAEWLTPAITSPEVTRSIPLGAKFFAKLQILRNFEKLFKKTYQHISEAIESILFFDSPPDAMGVFGVEKYRKTGLKGSF